MSKKRMIDTDFWSDTYVVDNLNPLDRYLFIYLFTNPHTTIAGVYPISIRIMSFETGIEREELARMLKRLEPKVKYVDGWIILVNGIKHQNYANSKIRTGIQMALAECPQELLDYIDFPEEWQSERPKGSLQLKLVENDLSSFDNNNPRLATHKSVVESNNTVENSVLLKATTPNRSGRLIHESSHSNSNSNSNKTAVGDFDAKPLTKVTTGLKIGENYTEVTLLYEDLDAKGLINQEFKAWYCSTFFKIGRSRIMILAAQARADTTGSAPKLFSHLLTKELEVIKT